MFSPAAREINNPGVYSFVCEQTGRFIAVDTREYQDSKHGPIPWVVIATVEARAIGRGRIFRQTRAVPVDFQHSAVGITCAIHADRMVSMEVTP